MNFKVFITSIALGTAVALGVYGFSPLLASSVGFGDILGSFWRLEAIALALSIAAGFAWPSIRGLRKGDSAVATIAMSRRLPTGHQIADYQVVPVVLLDSGRKGSRVNIAFGDGARGSAIVSEYAGMFTPASVQVVEREVK